MLMEEEEEQMSNDLILQGPWQWLGETYVGGKGPGQVYVGGSGPAEVHIGAEGAGQVV